jgi:DNA-binding NarL/FixJ family response regulator
VSIRVLIAEDHALVRSGIKSLLARYKDIEVVGEADNGHDAVAMHATLKPDVILMDLSMPKLNGVTASERIRRGDKRVGILVLTMSASRRTVSDALRAGVDGFLVKNCVTQELVQALREVADGRKYICSRVASLVVEAQATPAASPLDRLTLREKEVLQRLVEGDPVKQTARTLGIDRRTVDCHKQSILRKVGARSVTELTRWAIAEGVTPL